MRLLYLSKVSRITKFKHHRCLFQAMGCLRESRNWVHAHWPCMRTTNSPPSMAAAVLFGPGLDICIRYLAFWICKYWGCDRIKRLSDIAICTELIRGHEHVMSEGGRYPKANAVRNLVREVTWKCKWEGFKYSENFAVIICTWLIRIFSINI